MKEPIRYFHKSLRNSAINYRSGWWAVTIQVAKNKSIFGAVVGERVVLNEFGRAVEAYWKALPAKYPELELFDFVVMPNHFHALLRIHYVSANREHHLGFLMSRFKGGTSFIYGKMRRAGAVEDIGDHLWQRDYWDDLVTSESEFKGWQKYIRENPAHWSSDRYGACTAYAHGDIELLNRPRIAFVASQGYFAGEMRPRKIWAAEAARSDKAAGGDEAARFDKAAGVVEAARSDRAAGVVEATRFDRAAGVVEAARSDRAAGVVEAARFDKAAGVVEATRFDRAAGVVEAARSDKAAASERDGGDDSRVNLSGGAASAARVLISTFTSAQEREALRRALVKRKPLVAVFPAGIPCEDEMPCSLATAIREGRALAISPQPSGARLNKKIATWCNEFVIRNAEEIWVGDLSSNGMLTQMLKGLGKLK